MTEKVPKYLVLTVLSLLLTASLSAEVTFSVTPVYSTSWGTLHEYVLHDNDGNGDYEYILSRLDWDIDALPVYGGECTLLYTTELQHSFSFTGSALTAVSTRSGNLQDYDWFHLENGRYCGALTMYSIHENTLQSLHELSFNGEWVNPAGFGISIGWDYRQMQFSAKGGYFQYGEDISEFSTGHVDLNTTAKEWDKSGLPLINYEYLCNYLKLGITYHVGAPGKLQLSCGLWGIPLYAATGKDKHLRRSKYFYDDMYGYFCGFSQSAAISIPVLPHISLYCREEGDFISLVKGLSYEWNGYSMPNAREVKSGSGSSLERFTLSAGVTLSF